MARRGARGWHMDHCKTLYDSALGNAVHLFSRLSTNLPHLLHIFPTFLHNPSQGVKNADS